MPFFQVQGRPLDLLLGMAIEFPFTLAGGVLALALFGGFGTTTFCRAGAGGGDRPAEGRAGAQPSRHLLRLVEPADAVACDAPTL